MDPTEVISQRDHPWAYSHFLKTELGCLAGGGEEVLGQFAIRSS